MDRREDEVVLEMCIFCGEEADLLDAGSHARVRGRTICRNCAARQGGVYNEHSEAWSRLPSLPEPLQPRED